MNTSPVQDYDTMIDMDVHTFNRSTSNSCRTSFSSESSTSASSSSSTTLSTSITPTTSNHWDEVGSYDVLCGRDKDAFNHIGNRRFRVTVSLAMDRYLQAKTRQDKTIVIMSVIDIVHANGGRFVKRNKKDGRLIELDDTARQQKVGHAIRDSAVAKNLVKPTPKTQSRSSISTTNSLRKQQQTNSSTAPTKPSQQVISEERPIVSQEAMTPLPEQQEQQPSPPPIFCHHTLYASPSFSNLINYNNYNELQQQVAENNQKSTMTSVPSFASHLLPLPKSCRNETIGELDLTENEYANLQMDSEQQLYTADIFSNFSDSTADLQHVQHASNNPRLSSIGSATSLSSSNSNYQWNNSTCV